MQEEIIGGKEKHNCISCYKTIGEKKPSYCSIKREFSNKSRKETRRAKKDDGTDVTLANKLPLVQCKKRCY